MPVDFTPTDDQRSLHARAREFARDVLARVPEECLRLPTPEERFRATRPHYEALIAAGFLKRLVPAPFGGEGNGSVDMAIVAEEFHAVDVNVSLTMFANLLGLMPVFIAGTEEQRRRLVAPFLETRGAPLAGLANSEPGGSANFDAPPPAEGVRTSARRENGGWRIDGTKHWVSSATGWDGRGADVLSVVARAQADGPDAGGITVFAATGPIGGLVDEGGAETLGHRAHLVPRFRLDGTRVDADDVIGPVGGGAEIVAGSFTGTAALVGVMATGVMRAAFDEALGFARRERRGGACPVIEHQGVGFALGDAKGTLEAARSLSWRACAAADAQAPGAAELALHSKVFCSEAAVRTLADLMRVVGIDAYDHGLSPLGRLAQDAAVLPLFDGGNNGVRRRQLHALLAAKGYEGASTVG